MRVFVALSIATWIIFIALFYALAKEEGSAAGDNPVFNIDVICLEGHQYYWLNPRSFAIKLDDWGMPVPCVKP